MGERREHTLSGNDCSAKFMGYFNKGTGAYSYPLHGASAGKPPVAPASNQYVTHTEKQREGEKERGREGERGREREKGNIMAQSACLFALSACLPV